MKLGDNILKYWEAFTWKDETSDNKLSNCSLYFTALQYINNLETKRSYKRTVNLDSYFFKKIYRTVSKLFANLLKYTEMFTEPLTRVPRYVLIITFFPAIGWSYLHDLSHVFKKTETACQELRFLQTTIEHQDCPFFTVFLAIKTSSQNILITLLQISLKLHEHRGGYWRRKSSPERFWNKSCQWREILLQVK